MSAVLHALLLTSKSYNLDVPYESEPKVETNFGADVEAGMMHAETECILLFDPIADSNQASLSVHVALREQVAELSTLVDDIICQKMDISVICSNERFCEVVSQLSKF